MNSIVIFLRKLFRSYSDGLRHAGYPETYSGRYLTKADDPHVVEVPEDHRRVQDDVPLDRRARLG